MSLPFVSARGNRGGTFAAGPAAPPASEAKVTRQDDLTHWWKLDDDGSDSIGGADFTLTNGASISNSNYKFGDGALELDGTNDYAVTADGGVTTVASAYTLSLWARPTETVVDLTGLIAVNDDVTPGFTTSLTWLVRTTAKVSMYHGTTSSFVSYSGSGSGITLDSWIFLAQTWDGSNVKYWYADATAADSDITALETDATDSVKGSLDTVLVGNSQWNRYYGGQIDDIRLYNVGLTESELNEVYNGGDGDF